jgi:ERCC4-type nuclease
MARLSSYVTGHEKTNKSRSKSGGAKRKAPKRSYDFKPTEIPEGFILKIDSREQYPLFGNVRTNPTGLAIIRDTVPVGDYTVHGMEELVAIERKGVSDFFTYIGKDADKTLAKLDKLKAMKFKAIVIEADEDDLYYPSIPTTLTKEHVRGRLVSFRVKYGIHVYISRDRADLERFVVDHLVKAYNMIRENKDN